MGARRSIFLLPSSLDYDFEKQSAAFVRIQVQPKSTLSSICSLSFPASLPLGSHSCFLGITFPHSEGSVSKLVPLAQFLRESTLRHIEFKSLGSGAGLWV